MTQGSEIFRLEAMKKIVHGDLFAWKNPVITIMTRGRTYGALSRQVAKLGVPLPDLVLGCAAFHDPYIFVALWEDESTYTPRLFAGCGASILNAASRANVPLVAIPLLGDKKQAVENLGFVEKALCDTADELDARERLVPDWVYVTAGFVDVE